MIQLKKIISAVLLCAMILSLFSCVEFKEAVDKGDGSKPNKNPDGTTAQPDLDDDPTNNFTVQIRANGQPYKPTISMDVYWSDGYNVYVAPVDETGLAVIDGLDGDYTVTLSAVPSGFAYDPNDYVATNNNRNIIIDMYDLNLLLGSGTEYFDCYQINATGVYTVTLKDENDRVYVQFSPQNNGQYTVESWVNVIEDNVSPICTAFPSPYLSSGGYRITKTGVCGSYTRNFVYAVEIADENISTGGGGSHSFKFAVSAETKNAVYPVTLTFAIKRNGDFDYDRAEKQNMLPEHDWSSFDFDSFNSLAGGNIVGAEVLYPGSDNAYVFDQSLYKVWETSAGGDGVYHLYDLEKYPDTNGYGPILVAYITTPCRFLETNNISFSNIDDEGHGALSNIQGMYNYKLFVEGFDAVASKGYYCTDACPCHLDGSTKACAFGANGEKCPDCTKDCTNVTADLMAVKGYADLCNADGVAPVTPELAEFLQRFAIGMRYFADGGGFIDNEPADSTDPSFDAYEDSQWLFPCGYYVG